MRDAVCDLSRQKPLPSKSCRGVYAGDLYVACKSSCTCDCVYGMQELAVLLQSRLSEILHVDIHPAANIGRGILMDHATGIVIGETAVVGDNVSLLHQVTLGGSGTGKGVRHPHVGETMFPGCIGCALPDDTVLDGQVISRLTA